MCMPTRRILLAHQGADGGGDLEQDLPLAASTANWVEGSSHVWDIVEEIVMLECEGGDSAGAEFNLRSDSVPSGRVQARRGGDGRVLREVRGRGGRVPAGVRSTCAPRPCPSRASARSPRVSSDCRISQLYRRPSRRPRAAPVPRSCRRLLRAGHECDKHSVLTYLVERTLSLHHRWQAGVEGRLLRAPAGRGIACGRRGWGEPRGGGGGQA